jgi:hypothetical protein
MRIQTSMIRVEFESTIPTFEQAKTIHALDLAATVVGPPTSYRMNNKAPSYELSGIHHLEPKLRVLKALSPLPPYTIPVWCDRHEEIYVVLS